MSLPVIFIRDDDVWAKDAVFLDLFGALCELRVPVIYGIVPALLKKNMAAFLKGQKARDPYLFDIVQHGWTHRDHSRGGNDKYEFGPRRTYRQQLADMARGKKLMAEQFGPYFMPAFVPPYHGYDENTIKAVVRSRFPVFSAGEKTAARTTAFWDLPARVSLNDYAEDGTPVGISTRDMLGRMLPSLRPGRMTGLVFHHRVIRTKSELGAILMFFRAVARMKRNGQIRIVLFSDLLRHARLRIGPGPLRQAKEFNRFRKEPA